MNLSTDLIKDFAKVTDDSPKETKETTFLYGTARINGVQTLVQFDGSDTYTPVERNIDVKTGDRVLVMVKGHSASISSNVSSPAVNNASFTEYKTEAENTYVKTTALEADYITADQIAARYASIQTLQANYITADEIAAGYADIDLANIARGTITQYMLGDGVVGTAQIADGSITDAKIVGLTANKITAGRLDAANIEVVNLNASNITTGTINGQRIDSGAIDISKLSTELSDTINGTVTEVIVLYALSDSTTVAPTGGWSAVAPSWTEGMYMWQKTMTVYTNGTSEESDPTCISGAKGQDGSSAQHGNLVLGTSVPKSSTSGIYIFDPYNLIAPVTALGLTEDGKVTISFEYEAEHVPAGGETVYIGFNDAPYDCLGSFDISLDGQLLYDTEGIEVLDTSGDSIITEDIYSTEILDSNNAIILDSANRPINGSGRGGSGTATGFVTLTTTVTQSMLSSNGNAIRFRFAKKDQADDDSSFIFTVNSLKLELGEHATPWSPAVEELKNSVFFQDTAPEGETYSVNDIWFDTDNGNKIHYWTGTAWVAKEYGSNAIAEEAINTRHIMPAAITESLIAANAVTADKIVAEAITAAKINVEDVFANSAVITEIFAQNVTATGTITGSTLVGSNVISGTLKSSNYAAGTGPYSSAGMIIDLTNNAISTPKFAVKSDGSIAATSASISGDITGTTFTALEKIYIHDNTGVKKIAVDGIRDGAGAAFGDVLTIGRDFMSVAVSSWGGMSCKRSFTVYGSTETSTDASIDSYGSIYASTTLGCGGNFTAIGTAQFADIAGNNLRYGITTGTSGYQVARIYTNSGSNSATLVAQKGGSAFSNYTVTISSSDIRLKERIHDTEISSATDLINSIKLRAFDWKDDKRHVKIGFIADELEELDENLAIGGGYDEDGLMSVKTVDTFYMMGYLVKALQEANERIRKLEERV